MEFLCRTCLKSSQNLLDLFCEDLPHQIEVISSIQILTDDGFPTKICEDCAKNVHFLYDFRKTIVESDATLKAGFILESEQSNPNDDDIVIDEVKLEPFESNDSEATDPFTELANVEKDCPEKIGPRRGYSCKKCDFTTTSYELRRKHHLVHRKVIKVVCNVCGASIRSDNIGKHMSNIHTPSPASCTICEKVFKSKEALGWHMISHQKISLQCTECGKVYTTKKSYRKHLKRHSVADARTEECSICEKRFFTKCVLKSHFRSHTGERPYPCRYCKKGFSSSFALRTHIRQHTNEKPYKCEHCDAAFPQRVSLRTHIKSKHSDKVIILTDDGLPTKICEDCARNVHFLYGFRKTIVESDAMLKESYVLESEESKPKEEQPSEYDIVIDEIVIDEVKLEPFESNDSDVTDPFIMLPNVEKDCPEKITKQQKITRKRKHKGYFCKKCDFTTTSYELQRKHRLVHRNTKVLKVICNVCGVYVRSDNLSKHMSNLHTPSPASCHICEKLFKSKDSLKWHMRTHRKLSLQCTECGKVFTTKNSYRNHMKRHSVTKPEECSICKKQFYTKCDLKKHFRSHTGERPYPCRYCNKGFSSSFALRTHIRQHTNEKPYKCEHCDAAFPQRVSLRTHNKSKHPDKILTDDGLPTKICEDCARNVHFLYGFRKTIVESDAMLKESYVLESEEIKPKEEQPSEYDIVIDEIVIDEVKLEPFESNDSDVTDPFIMLPNVEKDCPEKITEQQKITSKKKHKGYSCKKCDFTTTSYELQRKHRLVHRNRKVLKVICNVCGVYVRSDHLGKHMSNLHTPSPASCHICEKLFKSKESLKWHMSTHRKLSLQCTECGKVYTTKNSYRNHMKRHSDTKPEECSICKKQFYTKCDLKTHFRSHTGERPYPCRYCNKGFSSGNALRTHIRRHTNEKPFKCEYCDAAFPQRVSLRTHIKSKHPDKMIVGEIKKE